MSKNKKPDLSQYSYTAMSSLVLSTDRSALPRRDQEPTGEPESLVGRINPKDMGSRVQRESVKDLDKKKAKISPQDATDRQRKKAAAASTSGAAGGYAYADILEATQEIEGLTYRPRTAETREIYQLIISVIHNALGDQANDIVRSAADTALEFLKNEDMKDFDKKKEIESIIGPLTNEAFSQLVNLSKKITDYAEEEEKVVDPDAERRGAQIDEDGVVSTSLVQNRELAD